jgi:thiamine-monophosphate kinase
MTVPQALPDEFALIARLFAPLARGFPGAYGLLDDAATVAVPAGEELVITKDLMVEGVHYLPDDPAGLIARKLIRVNVSDLAAKGAKPLAYLLGVALPKTVTLAWLDAFAAGLTEDQARYGMHLIGGDTAATDGPAVLSLTALGTLPAGTMLRRDGAKPGDRLYISGTIGDAALGLRALRGELAGMSAAAREHLIDRYRLPRPRPELGLRLRGLAHASLDVSDGLVADLDHICAVSRVGAEIEAARLPLSDAAQAALEVEPALLKSILTGGDDYEILFTTPAGRDTGVAAAAAAASVPVTQIGRIVEGRGIRVVGLDGKPLPIADGGYRHF